jgi:hypothetical protein
LNGHFGVTNVDKQNDATLDQTDEDILNWDVSDEALEAYASTDVGRFCASVFYSFCGRVGEC